MRERDPEQTRCRVPDADEERDAAAAERDRLVPSDEILRLRGVAEHRPRMGAARDQRKADTRRCRRGQRDLEIDRRASVGRARAEPEIEGLPVAPEGDEGRARPRAERGPPGAGQQMVGQEVGVADAGDDARRAAGSGDERHAGERRARVDVGSEHGGKPSRVEAARRDDPIRGGEDLVDGRGEVLHAEERLRRRPVDPLAIELGDVVAHDEEEARRGDRADDGDQDAGPGNARAQ